MSELMLWEDVKVCTEEDRGDLGWGGWGRSGCFKSQLEKKGSYS